MTNKTAIYGSCATLLLALNLWYWWPGDVDSPGGNGSTGVLGRMRVDEFRLRLPPEPSAEHKRVARNLFQPKLPKIPAPPKPAAPKAKKPPPPSPRAIARKKADSDMEQIRFVGLVMRDNMRQAFLLRDGRTFLLRVGEKLDGRYVVERITLNEIFLRDSATKAARYIPMAGNQ